MYSAHDTQIANLLSTIDKPYNYTYVKYASQIYFELYKNSAQETFAVKTMYNGKPLQFSECAGEHCTLSEFQAHMTANLDVIPD